VAAGPGSFTGLRSGSRRDPGPRVHRAESAWSPVLRSMRLRIGSETLTGRVVVGWIDAHRREVFSAVYRVGTGAPVRPRAARDRRRHECGAAAGHAQRLQTIEAAPIASRATARRCTRMTSVERCPPRYPSAAADRRRGWADRLRARARNETIDPAAIQPLYVAGRTREVAATRAGSVGGRMRQRRTRSRR